MGLIQEDCSFGLDLAGLAGGRSRLARARQGKDGQIEVTVFRTRLGPPRRDTQNAGLVKEPWQRVLKACMARGPLFVDVPIDLQGLPAEEPEFLWQLTHRPIDYAFAALPPFASWIGYLCAGFQFLIGGDIQHCGTRLFETYPAASLALMQEGSGERDQYKSRKARKSDSGWVAISKKGLAEILERLDVQAELGVTLDDDDVDAMLCALTGVKGVRATTLEELKEEVKRRLEERLGGEAAARLAAVPETYYLLKEVSRSAVHVAVEEPRSTEELLALL
jgi:hypothetical protein